MDAGLCGSNVRFLFSLSLLLFCFLVFLLNDVRSCPCRLSCPVLLVVVESTTGTCLSCLERCTVFHFLAFLLLVRLILALSVV
jgi:hypothetical protein